MSTGHSTIGNGPSAPPTIENPGDPLHTKVDDSNLSTDYNPPIKGEGGAASCVIAPNVFSGDNITSQTAPSDEISTKESDVKTAQMLDYKAMGLQCKNVNEIKGIDQFGISYIGHETGQLINDFIDNVRNGYETDPDICLCMDERYIKTQSFMCEHNSRFHIDSMDPESLASCQQGSEAAAWIDQDMKWDDQPTGSTIGKGVYCHSYNTARLYKDRIKLYPTMNTDVKPSWLHEIYNQVIRTGLPNVLGARIPIPSSIKIDEWRKIQSQHPDDQWIIQCLEFGFPMEYGGPPTPMMECSNHPSATNYQKSIFSYLLVEMEYGTVIQLPPNPFDDWFHLSPLMTAEKSNPQDRRVIVDLSFPEGSSINEHVQKNCLFGFTMPHKLPSIQHAVSMIRDMDFQVKIACLDIQRAYRNLVSCPLGWPLLCITDGERNFLDIAMPFGTRLSSLYMQRAALIITRHLHSVGINAIFYLDDLLICHQVDCDPTVQFAYAMKLVHKLGLPINFKKVFDPCSKLVWLGFQLDIQRRIITLPTKKISVLLLLINGIKKKKSVELKCLQRVVGKINHFAQVVVCARLFVSRILEAMRGVAQEEQVPISDGIRADMRWMSKFLTNINFRSMMTSPPPSHTVWADSSMEAGGGHDDTHYYVISYTKKMSNRHHISQLEALNCLVALKTLSADYPEDSHILVVCDNQASIMSFNGFRARDPVISAVCRAMWYYAHLKHFSLSFTHCPGEKMTLSDAISRKEMGHRYRNIAEQLTEQLGLTQIPPVRSAANYSEFL